MPVVSASLDVFLFTVIACIVSWLYFTPRAQRFSILNVIVVLHSAYILRTITLDAPMNIFTSLRLPLTMPTDKIRALFVDLGGYQTLPRQLETLLTRLSSFDVRVFFVRFGQPVIQECDYCHSFEDYALFALPGPLLQYIRTAAIVGILTHSGTHRQHWRKYSIGALVLAAVCEAYWVYIAPVEIPRDGMNVPMWHDHLWMARHGIFLVLPILLRIVPASLPPPTPLTMLPNAITAIERLAARVTLLRYIHGATMRNSELRAASGASWAREQQLGERVRGDERVQRAAERVDLGFTAGDEDHPEGKLRRSARAAVAALKAGFANVS